MNIARKMVYQFFDLPYVRRMDVVTKLGLTRDSDSEIPENQRYPEYFKRATELGVVEELREAICLAGTAQRETGDTMKERIDLLRRAVKYGLDSGKNNMAVDLDVLRAIFDGEENEDTVPTPGQRSRPLGQDIPGEPSRPATECVAPVPRHLKPLPYDSDVLFATSVLIDACHGRSWNAGWYHDPITGRLITRNFGEMLALIHSEISEALEGHRKNLMDDKLPHRKMAPVELFDAVIRIFDLIGYAFPDDCPALLEKLKYNDTRADHKPENRAKADGKKF